MLIKPKTEKGGSWCVLCKRLLCLAASSLVLAQAVAVQVAVSWGGAAERWLALSNAKCLDGAESAAANGVLICWLGRKQVQLDASQGSQPVPSRRTSLQIRPIGGDMV